MAKMPRQSAMRLAPCDGHDVTATTMRPGLTGSSLFLQGLVDAGSVSEAPNLRLVNLSFNKLESVRGLASLAHLATLNISHNMVT